MRFVSCMFAHVGGAQARCRSVRQVSCLSLAIILRFVLAPLPCVAADDTFKSVEQFPLPVMKEFVDEAVSMQERVDSFENNSDVPKPMSKAESKMFSTCWKFAYTDFYARFADILDTMDTAPFESSADYRRDRTDASVLFDPREVVIETRNVVDLYAHEEQYQLGLHDFAVKMSANSSLRLLCHAYLDDH